MKLMDVFLFHFFYSLYHKAFWYCELSDLHGRLLRGKDPHVVVISLMWEGEWGRGCATQLC